MVSKRQPRAKPPTDDATASSDLPPGTMLGPRLPRGGIRSTAYGEDHPPTAELLRLAEELQRQALAPVVARLSGQWFSLGHVASQLAIQQGPGAYGVEPFRVALHAAALSRALVARDPLTLLPIDAAMEGVPIDHYVVRREDVNSWLESVSAPYRWGSSDLRSGTPSRPQLRSQQQDTQILDALKARLINALRMEKAPRGGQKPWPLREEIRVELNMTKAQIDHAWKRLRNEGHIKDA